jgi:hypothetical protein
VTVSSDDERLHPPGPELSWTETTWLEFYAPASELAGVVRLDVRPNQDASEVSLSFFLPDDGFVTARHVAPMASGAGSVVAIEDARLEIVEPLRHWRIAYDGPSHSLASVADAGRREAWQKSRLERLIVELDVTSAQDALPGKGSFVQPVRVAGEVWVSGDRYEIEARALRGKTWGSGVIPERASRIALTFGDDRALFARAEAGSAAAGAMQIVDGWTSVAGEVRPVVAVAIEPASAASDAARAVTLIVRDDRNEHRIAAELAHVAPMPGQRGGRPYELRVAVARARWDGRDGHGFVEELE